MKNNSKIGHKSIRTKRSKRSMKKRKEKKRKTLKFEALTAYIIRSLIFEKSESTVGRTNLINIYQRSIFLRWGRKKKKKEKTIQSKKYVYTHIAYISRERERQVESQSARTFHGYFC